MSISMFIEFPGILITIGVVLLIIAIIVGIVAYKKEENNDKKIFGDLDINDETITEDSNNKSINNNKKEEPILQEAKTIIDEEPNPIDDYKDLELKQNEIYNPFSSSSIATSNANLNNNEDEIELL